MGWQDTYVTRTNLMEALEAKLQTRMDNPSETESWIVKLRLKQFITRIVTRKGQNLMGYDAGGMRNFIDIHVAVNRLIEPLREVFGGYRKEESACAVKGVCIRVGYNETVVLNEGQTNTFESNIEATLQFLVDQNARYVDERTRRCCHPSHISLSS